jgi:phosphoserine phosphatase
MPYNIQPLDFPASAIIFDCDGTLSKIEGIDELAKANNVTHIVQKLTEKAMGKSGMTIELYNERLALVQPTYQQIVQLGNDYITHRVQDIDKVIQILKHLNKTIYIVSAGLHPSVNIFGNFFNIPSENIYAVDIHFDSLGKYVDFDRSSPLVHRNGKQIIVEQIKQKHTNTVYVGDGLNDLEVRDVVTRFIGYGGVFYRENIKSACEFYVDDSSMGAILPLIMTLDEVDLLTPQQKRVYTHYTSKCELKHSP